jgi:uncharacterized protein involved in exopolysaccharide biosynthesis
VNTPIPVDQGFEVIDLTGMFQQLWRGRWWIVLASLIGAAIASVVALTMTPVYRATAVLIPVRADRPGLEGSTASLPGSFGTLIGITELTNGTEEQRIEEALAVLRSRQFTERFIQEESLLPHLLPEWLGVPGIRWLLRGESQPTLGETVQVFNETVRIVSRDRKTNLVTLHMDWADPERAAELANAQVIMLNAEMRSRGLAEIDATLRYLQQELVRTDVLETQNAINRLIQVQTNQRVLANAKLEYSFRVVSEAMVPDREDRTRPQTAFLVVVGAIAGAAIGILAVLFRSSRRSTPAVS